ncbi:electron transport complex subunit RsxB [soil metagenome]
MAAVAIIAGLAAVAALGLGVAAMRLRADPDALVERIDAALPQIQCGQCGFPGCRPYAEAIAAGDAEINLCPPGGAATADALARLLDRETAPPSGAEAADHKAIIDENSCVGCALCLQACPVDAIVGAPRRMHTVIAEECTGCALCVPRCPVDCIALAAPSPPAWDWRWPPPRLLPADRHRV